MFLTHLYWLLCPCFAIFLLGHLFFSLQTPSWPSSELLYTKDLCVHACWRPTATLEFPKAHPRGSVEASHRVIPAPSPFVAAWAVYVRSLPASMLRLGPLLSWLTAALSSQLPTCQLLGTHTVGHQSSSLAFTASSLLPVCTGKPAQGSPLHWPHHPCVSLSPLIG